MGILVSIVTQTTLTDVQKSSGESLSRVNYKVSVLVLTTWLSLLSLPFTQSSFRYFHRTSMVQFDLGFRIMSQREKFLQQGSHD